MLDWASSCAELQLWALRSTAKPLSDTAVHVLSTGVLRSAGLGTVELPGALPDPSSANTLALLAALGASPSLTALHLQQNLLGSLATQTLANALAERFDGRAALRVLDFSQNEPLLNSGSEDFHAFEALCGALVDHAPHLQTLNLGSCGLQRTSAAALGTLLSGRYGNGGGGLALRELVLSSNLLGQEGGMALAAAIGKERCTLKVLELRRTNLGEPALLYASPPVRPLFAPSLQPAPSLQSARHFMSSSYLGCACVCRSRGGIRKLIGAITAHLPTLETLHLGGQMVCTTASLSC
jgi:hypothetical protein